MGFPYLTGRMVGVAETFVVVAVAAAAAVALVVVVELVEGGGQSLCLETMEQVRRYWKFGACGELQVAAVMRMKHILVAGDDAVVDAVQVA